MWVCSIRSFEEKTFFYNELQCEWDMHAADDFVMCLGIFNGHVGGHIDGVHSGYGVDQRNFEGRMVLILCVKYIQGLRHMKRGR